MGCGSSSAAPINTPAPTSPQGAVETDGGADDDGEFVPEEEEAGAEQHALGTQGDGLCSAKARRAGASTSPQRRMAGEDDGESFTTAAQENDPAPRRPPMPTVASSSLF